MQIMMQIKFAELCMEKKKILNLCHLHYKFAWPINERILHQTVNRTLTFSDHFPFNFAVNPN